MHDIRVFLLHIVDNYITKYFLTLMLCAWLKCVVDGVSKAVAHIVLNC